jgi:hypothetical protein
MLKPVTLAKEMGSQNRGKVYIIHAPKIKNQNPDPVLILETPKLNPETQN